MRFASAADELSAMLIPSVLIHRLLAVCTLLTSASLTASAQAVPTAQQHLQIESYAMASYVRPAYSGSPASGAISAGVDFNALHLPPGLAVGVDVRGVSAHSTAINEASLAFGPRIAYDRSWIQPYAEYLFGVGRGSFNNSDNPTYQRDYSAIRSYGGGIDVRASRNVTIRADAQTQRWRFTYLAPYFHPLQVSVGIAYRLHSRSRIGPQF